MNDDAGYDVVGHDDDVPSLPDFGDHQSADAFLAHELNQMTIQEREEISEEIHGIRKRQYPKETPKLLRDSLRQFRIELRNLPLNRAYKKSMDFPRSYVNTDDFQLIFLRYTYFDARKAAIRMLKYLNLIYFCFGEEILERDFSLDDFDNRALKILKAGYNQILPGRDRCGRRIAGNFFFDIDPSESKENRVRSAIFCIMTVLRIDVNSQRDGVVGVFWAHNFHFNDIGVRAWVHRHVMPVIPIRFSAIHICGLDFNCKIGSMLASMYLLSIGAENRKRIRIHVGSPTECIYMLQTFGIQTFQMPINLNTGQIKNQNHQKWIHMMRIRQDAMNENQSFHGVECPEQRDVLFGRGWPKMYHPGNAIFRDMIEARIEAYNTVESKREKTMIAWSIVFELLDSGARFLREDTAGWWMEVTNDEARQKVSIAFRDFRKARHRSNRKSKKKDIAINYGDSSTDGEKVPPAVSKHQSDATCDRQKAPRTAKKSPFSSDESVSSFKRKHAAPDATRFSDTVRGDDAITIFLEMDGIKKPRCLACDGDEEKEHDSN